MTKSILYITPFEPNYYQGGGRVCYLNLLALLEDGYAVTYIGPKFQETDELNYKRFYAKYIIEKYKFIDRFKSLISFTNVFSIFADKVLNHLDISQIDKVFCESTRLKIFDNKALKDKRVFTIVHNVEYDYYKFNFHGILGKLKHIAIQNIESRILKLQNNKLIFFHQEDIDKISERYNYDDFKRYILPVCIKETNLKLEEKKNRQLLFVGSLDIKYNHDGIINFIKICMGELSDFHLIIAGRNPKDELQELVAKYPNIELFENPQAIEPFFIKRSIFLNPDMSGSGMKLKVAEALSFALPIVSTKLGANGYTKLDSNCGIVVEEIKDFKNAIYNIENSYDKFSKKALEYFQEEFSYENYKKNLLNILEEHEYNSYS